MLQAGSEHTHRSDSPATEIRFDTPPDHDTPGTAGCHARPRQTKPDAMPSPRGRDRAETAENSGCLAGPQRRAASHSRPPHPPGHATRGTPQSAPSVAMPACDFENLPFASRLSVGPSPQDSELNPWG